MVFGQSLQCSRILRGESRCGARMAGTLSVPLAPCQHYWHLALGSLSLLTLPHSTCWARVGLVAASYKCSRSGNVAPVLRLTRERKECARQSSVGDIFLAVCVVADLAYAFIVDIAGVRLGFEMVFVWEDFFSLRATAVCLFDCCVVCCSFCLWLWTLLKSYLVPFDVRWSHEDKIRSINCIYNLNALLIVTLTPYYHTYIYIHEL